MKLRLFAACSIAALACPAYAVTYTGTASPTTGTFTLYLDPPFTPGSTDPTNWIITVDLDQAHLSTIWFNYFFDYEVYDRATGVWQYGNSSWILERYQSTASDYSDTWTLPGNEVRYSATEVKYIYNTRPFFQFELQNFSQPINYTITVDLAPPASGVPEPTSWAMMIAGFGLAGAALRGRRRSANLQPHFG